MNPSNSNVERKSLSLLTRLAACWIIAACLTGCGKNVKGTYTGDTPIGTVTLEIRGGHKALGSMGGQSRELTYTVDGDKVIIDTGKGKEVYSIQKDGSLSRGTGMMSVTLKKK
jgi:hypothetical protein